MISTSALKLEKAASIDGWMQEAELLWLADRATGHKLIVEIGSHMGRSSRALADNTPGQLICIDDWNGDRSTELTDSERALLFPMFNANLGDLLFTRKVIAHRIDHKLVNTKPEIEVLRPDMVFLDGSHKYQDVKNDIETWLPKLTSGGLMCGHDASYPDIEKVVNEFFPNVQVDSGTTIWWSIKA